MNESGLPLAITSPDRSAWVSTTSRASENAFRVSQEILLTDASGASSASVATPVSSTVRVRRSVGTERAFGMGEGR